MAALPPGVFPPSNIGGGHRPIPPIPPIPPGAPMPPSAAAGLHSINVAGPSMQTGFNGIPRAQVRPGMGGGPVPMQQHAAAHQQEQFHPQQQQPGIGAINGMNQVPMPNAQMQPPMNQGQSYRPQQQQQQHANQLAPKQRGREHRDEVVDLRYENMFEDEARQELTTYIVWRMEKTRNPNATDRLGNPILPTWECATHTKEKDISQKEAARRVYELNKNTPRIIYKKRDLPEAVQRQIERAQQSLQEEEEDDRYGYELAQLESKIIEIHQDNPLYHIHSSSSGKEKKGRDRDRDRDRDKDRDRKDKHKDRHRRGKEYRSDKEHRGDKKKRDRKYERASVTAYFRRVPKSNEDAIEMLQERRMPKRQSSLPTGQPQHHPMPVPMPVPMPMPMPMPIPMGNVADGHAAHQGQQRMNMPQGQGQQQTMNANPAMAQQFRPTQQQQQQQQQPRPPQPPQPPQPRPQHPQQQQQQQQHPPPFRQQQPQPQSQPFPHQGQHVPRPQPAPPSRPMPPQVPPQVPPPPPPPSSSLSSSASSSSSSSSSSPWQQQQRPPPSRPSPPAPHIPRVPNMPPGPNRPSCPNTPHNQRSFTPNRETKPVGPPQRAPRVYVESPSSPRSSGDSVTSFESDCSSDEGDYITPQSSVTSSTRYYRNRRYPSKHRHGRRDRPEQFGHDMASHRQHSKRDKGHATPPSPASTSSSPRQQAFEYDTGFQRGYHIGKEDGIQQNRPVVVQDHAPRAIPGHRVRQGLHQGQLDDMSRALEQMRIADHLRDERAYRRNRDHQYPWAEDDLDLERGRRYGGRISRRDLVDDDYDDDLGDRWGTRYGGRMSRRDIVDDAYDDEVGERWTPPTARDDRYNPMMPVGGGYRPPSRRQHWT